MSRVLFACLTILILQIVQVEAQQSFLPPLEPIRRDVSGIEPLARLGRGHFEDLAWSPGGRWLAVGSSIGVWLFDPYDLQADPRLVNDRPTQSALVEFNPDGTLLAAAGAEGIQLWRTDTWTLLTTLDTNGGVMSIAFSPDNTMLASSSDFESDEHQITLWSLDDNSKKMVIATPSFVAGKLTFSPDGSRIAAIELCDCDFRTQVWDTATGEEIFVDASNTQGSREVRFSSDGQQLMIGKSSGDIALFNAQTGASEGYTALDTGDHDSWYPVLTRFTPDGKRILSITPKGELRVLDAKTLDIIDKKSLGQQVRKAALHPDGNRLVVLFSNQLTLYDLSSMKVISSRFDPYVNSKSLAFSSQGLIAAAAVEDVLVWDSMTGELKETLQGHTKRVTDLAFSPDGLILASGSEDMTVRLWDVIGGTTIKAIENDMPITHVLFSKQGLITADIKGILRLYDPQTGKALSWAGKSQVSDIHTFPDDHSIDDIVVSAGGKIYVADFSFVGVCYADGYPGCKSFLPYIEHQPVVKALAINSYELLTGGYDRVVQAWNFGTAQYSGVLTTHNSWIYAIAVDNESDPSVIASAGCARTFHNPWDGSPECDGGDLRLWDVYGYGSPLTGMIIAPPGHTAPVRDLAFNADGTLLASVSDDGSVILWGVREPN